MIYQIQNNQILHPLLTHLELNYSDFLFTSLRMSRDEPITDFLDSSSLINATLLITLKVY